VRIFILAILAFALCSCADSYEILGLHLKRGDQYETSVTVTFLAQETRGTRAALPPRRSALQAPPLCLEPSATLGSRKEESEFSRRKDTRVWYRPVDQTRSWAMLEGYFGCSILLGVSQSLGQESRHSCLLVGLLYRKERRMSTAPPNTVPDSALIPADRSHLRARKPSSFR
jgi:hypothetical protein